MQAVVFDRREHLEVRAITPPTPRRGEVRVTVDRAGICGTDIHIYRDEYVSQFPLVPGHEFVGRVHSLGEDVTTLAPGDRVAVDPNIYCGHCIFCRNRQNNQCLNWQGVGITRPGAFAESAVVPAAACYRVPDALGDAEAAFIEPVSCVVHAMNRLPVAAGDRVLLYGAGPMGLLLVQALRHRGAGRLVVVDRQADRLALAESMGAGATVPANDDADRTLRDLEAHGYDVVIDATGVPSVVERSLSYLRPYGRYLQFGVTPRNAEIRVRPFDLFRHDWTWLGSFALCYTFEQAIQWMAAGVIDVKPLVSHHVPMSEFPGVFDAFAAGQTLKVHLTPGR